MVALGASDAGQAKVFLQGICEEMGWRPPPGALEAYANHSVYFVHHSQDELLHGVVKLVTRSEDEGLPIFETWPELDETCSRRAAELSVLALAPGARGRGTSFQPLAAEMWNYCARSGVTELWAELEPRMLAGYRRFGWPFELRGPLREYWGDSLYPCCMDIAAAGAVYRQRASRSDAYAAAWAQASRDTEYDAG